MQLYYFVKSSSRCELDSTVCLGRNNSQPAAMFNCFNRWNHNDDEDDDDTYKMTICTITTRRIIIAGGVQWTIVLVLSMTIDN